MEALIAFISLGIIVAALIEINERIKAKKKRNGSPADKPCNESCDEAGRESCAGCELIDTCNLPKQDVQ